MALIALISFAGLEPETYLVVVEQKMNSFGQAFLFLNVAFHTFRPN